MGKGSRKDGGTLKIACVNTERWKVGKEEWMIIEMKDAGFDLLGLTETQLSL